MRKFTLLIFAITFGLSAYSQWVVKDSITGPADRIEIDNLDHIYKVVNTEVFKYNKKGELLFRYSDKQLGNIGHIDVTYPLRPLLLYPELNYLVILDNTMSNNRGQINLLDHNIGLGLLACSSVQNHFWFYDAMKFALIRTDENFKEVSSTGNLAQILGIELNPTSMTEFANRLYVMNPSTGIMVFDIFGTYIKTIPVTGITDFQVFENEIAYLDKNTLIRYNTLLFELKEIELPYICKSAQIQKNSLILLTDQKILILEKPKL